jgi:hypothetical protein
MHIDSTLKRRAGITALFTFVILAFLIVFRGFAHAATPVLELPIENVSSLFCISLSTSSWTYFGPTSNMQKRTGIVVLNPSSNSGKAVGMMGTALPTSSTSQYSIEVAPGSNPLRPVGPNVNLYLKTTNATAETICGQEVRQAY